MNTDRGRMNGFPGYFAGRGILRDNRCGERFAKKNSFAYHAESQLRKFMPSSEYFDWERRKDEVAARRLFLHLVVQKNFSAKLKNRRQLWQAVCSKIQSLQYMFNPLNNGFI